MATSGIDFEAPDLAQRMEKLSEGEIDQLSFGVILLDRTGVVQLYSKTEARLSGFPDSPVGKNFFMAPLCTKKGEILAQIMRAQETGAVDLEFGWKGDYAAPERELRIRVQSSRPDRIWMFIDRDAA